MESLLETSEAPIKHEFLSDKRIAELFPDPKLAAHVRRIRNEFRIRYEQGQLETYGKASVE